MGEQTITAKLNRLRIAPRKTRLVSGLIKGLRLDEARAQLLHCPKKASRPFLKLLNSAAANALSAYRIPADALKIASVKVDEGPPFKRWRPRARGAVNMILKKTSHITLILERIEKPEKPRFSIRQLAEKKKKKQKKAPRKKQAEKKEEKERETESSRQSWSKKSAGSGGGFFRRIFRRKAI